MHRKLRYALAAIFGAAAAFYAFWPFEVQLSRGIDRCAPSIFLVGAGPKGQSEFTDACLERLAGPFRAALLLGLLALVLTVGIDALDRRRRHGRSASPKSN